MKQPQDISFSHIPLESVKDGVFFLDLDGRILHVNQIIVDRTGRPAEWYLGRSYLEVIQPQYRSRMRAYFENALEGKQIPLCEMAYLDAKGRQIWVEHRTSAIWKNGEIVCFICISHDISVRKQLTRELKATSQRAAIREQQQTAALKRNILELKAEVGDRVVAEEALVDYQDQLEEIADRRTRDLKTINEKLITEIEMRKQIERDLKSREQDLAEKADHLTEANIALKVLMDYKRRDLRRVEEKVLFNVRELVMPYLEKLKRSRLDERQLTHLGLLETNLEWIVKPLKKGLEAKYVKLTPTEIQVASMVKHGKSTKWISQTMHLSPRTVEFHRDNIRKKFGIRGKKINLRSYLLTA